MRQCLKEAAEIRHRMFELRQRPLATAKPVGRACLAHSLEDADVKGSGDGGLNRHNGTRRTFDEPILRRCLDEAVGVRHRCIKLRRRPLATASPVRGDRCCGTVSRMMTSRELAMVASIGIRTHEGPSTSRPGDNVLRKPPNYDTEASNHDSYLSLLQAQ